MDSRLVGIGAILVFLSCSILLQTELVDARLAVTLVAITTLGVAVGALLHTTRVDPNRA